MVYLKKNGKKKYLMAQVSFLVPIEVPTDAPDQVEDYFAELLIAQERKRLTAGTLNYTREFLERAIIKPHED